MPKIPGPSSYVTLLDGVARERDSKNTQGMPLRPSNAGSCTRKLAYEYAAYLGHISIEKEEMKPSVVRLLGLGHYIEDHLVQDLKEIPTMGVRFQQQLVEMFVLPGGTQIEGSLDAVMWSDEVRGVLDVKSIGDRWSNHFASKWDYLMSTYKQHAEEFAMNSFYVEKLDEFLKAIGPDDSLYKNLIQLNLYACTDFLQRRKIDHASIVRYNKNNSALMEIRFKPSKKVYEETKRRLALAEKAGQENKIELAPKERVLGQMDCTYCPFKDECWPRAQKRDFYQNMPEKRWATKLTELQKGKELAALFKQRAKIEKSTNDLTELDKQIILLIEGHNVSKVKLDNGDVFEVKVLQKGAELRRSKE